MARIRLVRSDLALGGIQRCNQLEWYTSWFRTKLTYHNREGVLHDGRVINERRAR